MKKFLVFVLALFSFLTFIPTSSAFFSFDDVVEFFRGIFGIQSEQAEELASTDKNKITVPTITDEGGVVELTFEEDLVGDASLSDEERLAKIEAALREEDGIEKFSSVLDSGKNEDLETETKTTPEEIIPPEETEEPVYFDCETVVDTFNPTYKGYFSSLPYGSQNRHTEILRYKIKWFDGTWSSWFTPGKNDQDGDRHLWKHFADHNYQVEHCENYQYSPPQ